MSLVDFMVLLVIVCCVLLVGLGLFLGTDKDNITSYDDYDKKGE